MGDSSRSNEIIKDYQAAYDIYGEQLIPAQPEYKDLFRENQASCLLGEGTIHHYFLEQPAEAMDKYDQALQIYVQVQSADGIGVVNKQKGEIFANKQFQEFHNPEIALELFRAALQIFQKADYKNRSLETLYQMARLRKSEPEESVKLFEECFRIADELGLLREKAIISRQLAALEFVVYKRIHDQLAGLQDPRGDVVQAIIQTLADAARVLELFKFDGWSRRALTNCYASLGEIYKWLADNENAILYFRAALAVSDEDIFRNRLRGDVRRRVHVLLELVALLFQTDQNNEVESLVAEHVEDFKQLEIPYPTRGEIERSNDSLAEG